VSVFFEFAPALAGMLMAWMWVSSRFRSLPERLLAIPAGGFLGLFSALNILLLADLLNINGLAAAHYYSWGVMAAVLLIAFIISNFNESICAFRCHANYLLLILLSLFILLMSIFLLYMAIFLPIQGWDVLQGGEWGIQSFADRAVRVIESQSSGVDTWNPYDFRHPPYHFLLLAWGSYNLESPPDLIAQLGWLWLLVFVAGSVSAHTFRVYGSAATALVMFLVVISLPLAENHALILGYTELFLGLTLVLCCTFFSFALDGGGRAGYLLGFVFLVAVVLSKSAGLVFAFAVSAALLG
jgi:MFS family permease